MGSASVCIESSPLHFPGVDVEFRAGGHRGCAVVDAIITIVSISIQYTFIYLQIYEFFKNSDGTFIRKLLLMAVRFPKRSTRSIFSRKSLLPSNTFST